MSKMRRTCQRKNLKIIFGMIFALSFFATTSGFVLSAEDVPMLITKGETALARGDHEEAFSMGRSILREDPRNLNGYRLALIGCIATGREDAFYMLVEDAKKQGVPELLIDKLVAAILYVGYQPRLAAAYLLQYEKKWSETRDRSR